MLLDSLIIRILSGERLRKSTPAEKQNGVAYLCLLPVYFIVFQEFGRPLFEHRSATTLYIFFVSAVGCVFFGTWYWGKLVPQKTSMLLAAGTWSAFFMWVWARNYRG